MVKLSTLLNQQYSGYTGSQGIIGYDGSQGDAAGVEFTFSTTVTDADPGTGVVRFNNATFGSITQIFVDNLDANGIDTTTWLDTFDDSTNPNVKGTIYIKSALNADTTIAVFDVSGAVTDGTGYRKIAVTPIVGSIPSDTEGLRMTFAPAGDLGYTGSQGLIGFTGSQGDAAGIEYTFSTTITDADPGTGVIRFNNATFGSITQIFFDNTDANSSDVTAWLDTFDDSTNNVKGVIYIKSALNADTTFAIFNVTGAVTDGTGYRKVAVTPVSGSVPSDAEGLRVTFVAAGDLGFVGSQGIQGVIGYTGSKGLVPIRGITIEGPDSSDKVPFFFQGGEPLTITEIRTLVYGTNPEARISVRYDSDFTQVGTEVITGGILINDSAFGRSDSAGTFTVGIIPLDTFVFITVDSAPSGVVDAVHITLR